MTLKTLAILVITMAFASKAAAEELNFATIATLTNHPKVLAEVAKHLQATAEVERERAALYPKLEFTTDGGAKLFGNAPKSQARSLGAEEYVDGILTANQRLYDFGATTARIESAKLNENAQSLSPNIALNSLLSDAAKLVRNAVTRRQSIQIGQTAVAELDAELAREELRYQQGMQSAAEARRLSLRIETIKRQIESDQQTLRSIKTSSVDQFAIPLEQLEALYQRLKQIAEPSGGPTLLIKQLDRRKQAQIKQALAIEAERKPVLSLEIEGRAFDMDEGAGDYEVTGSLRLEIPFFDGGARDARHQAAVFTVKATDAEIQFEQRALKERLSQLASQSNLLERQLVSLDEQAIELAEQLQVGILKQGKTETSTGEIANSILAIYENDIELLSTRAERLRIEDERLELLQIWSEFFTVLKSTVSDE